VSHGNPRREREQRVAQNTPDPDLVKDGKELRSRREILMMRATDPQAVLTPITEAAIFLTVTVEAGAEDAVRNVLADVSGLRRSVGFRIPEGELTCVVGIGATAWDRLFGMPRPAELHPFAVALERKNP